LFRHAQAKKEDGEEKEALYLACNALQNYHKAMKYASTTSMDGLANLGMALVFAVKLKNRSEKGANCSQLVVRGARKYISFAKKNWQKYIGIQFITSSLINPLSANSKEVTSQNIDSIRNVLKALVNCLDGNINTAAAKLLTDMNLPSVSSLSDKNSKLNSPRVEKRRTKEKREREDSGLARSPSPPTRHEKTKRLVKSTGWREEDTPRERLGSEETGKRKAWGSSSLRKFYHFLTGSTTRKKERRKDRIGSFTPSETPRDNKQWRRYSEPKKRNRKETVDFVGVNESKLVPSSSFSKSNKKAQQPNSLHMKRKNSLSEMISRSRTESPAKWRKFSDPPRFGDLQKMSDPPKMERELRLTRKRSHDFLKKKIKKSSSSGSRQRSPRKKSKYMFFPPPS